MAEFIKLNVGGHEYITTKRTLCAYPESMLAKLVDGELPNTVDGEGRVQVTIDRNGELFGYVLDFLRSSKLALPKDFNRIDQLSLEADFFQIQPLIEEIEKRKLKPVAIRIQYFESMPGRFQITSYITGPSTEIEKLAFAKDWTPIDSEIAGYTSKAINIEPEEDYGSVKLRGTTMSNRLLVQDYLHSHGWEVERTQPVLVDMNTMTIDLPLVSITFRKSSE